MKLGDHVIWNDRLCTLRGFTPMGIANRRVLIDYRPDGDEVWVPLRDVVCLGEAPVSTGRSACSKGEAMGNGPNSGRTREAGSLHERTAATGNHGGPRLTKAEWSILRLVVEGRSNREIAQARLVAIATVKFHLANIYRKVGVVDRTELQLWASGAWADRGQLDEDWT
jgi:DNA-binding CsgD family transcriptional regulator